MASRDDTGTVDPNRDDTRRHTLEEVLELREEAWFRRGVVLSPECNRHIVEASIQQCDRMRA